MHPYIASTGFWRFTFWTCIGTVMFLALMPNDTDMPSLGWDKLNHFFAFAVMFILGRLAYPKRKRELLGGLFGYGVLIEFMQTLTPDRFMEVVDVVADCLGIVTGAAMDGLFRKRRQSD
ncbi:VanZ family protein [Methylomicrobium sp. RS1]|uniref:VanZ family protein n=1 Tax=Candidatus Methylomicrobium oryzae TaxID=2802053 RepID=UPI0019226041|nr:VanZ family protein [Methylomicrobium sp. RS1]MBL1265777.1 VanZ family protein [Methylomicrobium sp. RS1]